jgi:hypothetical protein
LKATEHDEGEIEVGVGEAEMIPKDRAPKQNPLLINEHVDEATLIKRGVKLLNHLVKQATRGESVGVGFAQFVCCVHGVKSFEEVTKRPYTLADTANVLDLAHRITKKAGRKSVKKNGVALEAGMDTFIWLAESSHSRPSKAFESTPYTEEEWKKVFPDGTRRLLDYLYPKPSERVYEKFVLHLWGWLQSLFFMGSACSPPPLTNPSRTPSDVL